jgi:hypothetical protein
MIANFDHNEHTRRPGWATYWERPRRRLPASICNLFGHVVPRRAPVPANGHSPSNYARCQRCDTPVKWFVVGQHRRGGLSATA